MSNTLKQTPCLPKLNVHTRCDIQTRLEHVIECSKYTPAQPHFREMKTEEQGENNESNTMQTYVVWANNIPIACIGGTTSADDAVDLVLPIVNKLLRKNRNRIRNEDGEIRENSSYASVVIYEGILLASKWGFGDYETWTPIMHLEAIVLDTTIHSENGIPHTLTTKHVLLVYIEESKEVVFARVAVHKNKESGVRILTYVLDALTKRKTTQKKKNKKPPLGFFEDEHTNNPKYAVAEEPDNNYSVYYFDSLPQRKIIQQIVLPVYYGTSYNPLLNKLSPSQVKISGKKQTRVRRRKSF